MKNLAVMTNVGVIGHIIQSTGDDIQGFIDYRQPKRSGFLVSRFPCDRGGGGNGEKYGQNKICANERQSEGW